MSLTPEWAQRIENWRKALPKNFYRPLGTVDLQGFTTFEQLTPEQARERSFAPMPQGTKWGAKWEYGWFAGEVVLPAEAAGQRIALRVDAGGESTIFVNGVVAGMKGWAHHEITLTREGVPGTHYDILLEAYAGHGPTPCSAGPATPYGTQTVPEPAAQQTTVGETTFGIWNEDVYQLWLDFETLFQLRQNIDTNSLRLAEIDQALREFTNIVDFELPYEQMMATVRAGREHLRPLLACVNGTTAPMMYCYGHSHIDVAWLWPLAETERKCARTFSSQLALMEEYPEYKFLQSQPHLYRMTQRLYPELYQRIKQAAKAGQFMPEGGMWVEADTNVSGGESLIRQFLHGKHFLRDEFGVECEMLWLPDVFGYSGALPQIMRGCGVKYFSTAKIYWSYSGGDPFPYDTFTWEGIDGSTVLTHLCNDYNAQTPPEPIIKRWNERHSRDGISARLYPFGFGDGGGGATRNHLEFLRREKDLEGMPRTRISSPIEYFKDLEAKGIPDARYVGELYFQEHRGTYTTQARTKRGNRKCELALREAEMWGAAAQTLRGWAFPLATIDEAWKGVLLNQFHDIIPGSSIHRVYEEAEALYADVLHTANETTSAAHSALAMPTNSLTAYNSLNWLRTALIPLPEGYAGAMSHDGTPLPTQQVDGQLLAEVAVPSCGWTTIRPAADSATILPVVNATPTTLENDLLRLIFNEYGEITSVFDKETQSEFAAGPCNNFKLFKDVPNFWDAWDINSMYEQAPVELTEKAMIEVVAQGPLVGILRITRPIGTSTLTQEVVLRRGCRRVEFRTVVDWQESHRMLKVGFPVAIHANEAVHEIQFGHIRRPNHRSRKFDADRFEVCNHKWTALLEENRGAAVLNDCKYGVNVLQNNINLTLLRSTMAPDMTADKGQQEFTYAFYVWNGCLAQSDVVREGYDLNCPVLASDGDAGEQSLFTVDAQNIVIEAVKPAEDGSCDVIVRLYEAKRSATRCTLTTTLPVTSVSRTNMLEVVEEELPISDDSIQLNFRPFEIKTLRLRR